MHISAERAALNSWREQRDGLLRLLRIHLIQASVPGAGQRHRSGREKSPQVMLSSLIWLGSSVPGGGERGCLYLRYLATPSAGGQGSGFAPICQFKVDWGHQGSGQRLIQLWKHLNKISPFITLTRSKIHQQVTNHRTAVVPECQAGWNQLQPFNN